MRGRSIIHAAYQQQVCGYSLCVICLTMEIAAEEMKVYPAVLFSGVTVKHTKISGSIKLVPKTGTLLMEIKNLGIKSSFFA